MLLPPAPLGASLAVTDASGVFHFDDNGQAYINGSLLIDDHGGGASNFNLALDPGIFGVLLELAAGLPGFLAELSEEFRQGVGRQVAAIRVAVGSGDTAGLKFAAHSIRGSCGTLGACGMAAIAGRLEDAPPTSPEAGWPLIERLETEYEAVRRALEAFAPAAAPASMA